MSMSVGKWMCVTGWALGAVLSLSDSSQGKKEAKKDKGLVKEWDKDVIQVFASLKNVGDESEENEDHQS